MPFLTNGGLTILAETILFRISISHNPSEPFGTLANAMALPMVGENVPDVTSPSPLLVTTFWWSRITPLPSNTKPTMVLLAPLSFNASNASRPTKRLSSSVRSTVQVSAASSGETSSFISEPYKLIPASSLNVSRAPKPQGLTPTSMSIFQVNSADFSGSIISKPSSPV